MERLRFKFKSKNDYLGLRVKCRPYEFECFDGSSCISDVLKCDGYPDCRDQSDENPELCKGNWPRP